MEYRTPDDILAAQAERDASKAAQTSNYPPGYMSGFTMITADDKKRMDISGGTAEILRQDIQITHDTPIEEVTWITTRLNSTTYYLYLSKYGEFFADVQNPNFDNTHGGFYHTAGYRYIGAFYIGATGLFVRVIEHNPVRVNDFSAGIVGVTGIEYTDIGTPEVEGSYITAESIGIYKDNAWTFRAQSSGDCGIGDYAGGNAGVFYDKSEATLSVRGSIAILNPGDIEMSTLSGDLDDIADGTIHGKTTHNEVTGASRAYTAIDSSNDLVTRAIPATNAPGSPSDGAYVAADYIGIYKSGWKAYLNSDGDLYGGYGGTDVTAGQFLLWDRSVGAITISGSLTAISGFERVDIDQGQIKFSYSGTQYAEISVNEVGISGVLTFDSDYIDYRKNNTRFALFQPLSSQFLNTLGATIVELQPNVPALYIDADIKTTDNNTWDIGNNSYKYKDLYLAGTVYAATIDLGTNTISDGNLTGNWAYNSGNLSGIGTVGCGAITTSAILTISSGGMSITGDITYTDSNFDITANTSDGSDNKAIRLGGGGDIVATRGARIELYGNEHASTGVLVLAAGNVSGGDITVQTQNTERIRVEYNGDVNIDSGAIFYDKDVQRLGIGTAAPSYAFEVAGTSHGIALTDSGDSYNLRAYLWESGGNGGLLDLYDDSETIGVRLRSYGDCYFIGGNVGINDSTPSYALDVNGTVRATGVITADSDVTYTASACNIKADDDSSLVRICGGSIAGTDNGAWITLVGNDSGGSGNGGQIYYSAGNETGGDHIFRVGPGYEALRIENNKDIKMTLTTEALVFTDAGSTGATEQDWVEVTVGGNTGYVRVYASK